MSSPTSPQLSPLTDSFFAGPTPDVAPALIGCILKVGQTAGRIVEVEAYTDDDASHGARRTTRSNIMHDTYGMVYVYFVYGMYHCLNFTTDRRNVGAVLIRAVEPVDGIALMRRRRKLSDIRSLCNGPGKLCVAFRINERMNWSAVGDKVQVFRGVRGEIATGPRIGIAKATDLHWRFYERDNPFVSRRAL